MFVASNPNKISLFGLELILCVRKDWQVERPNDFNSCFSRIELFPKWKGFRRWCRLYQNFNQVMRWVIISLWNDYEDDDDDYDDTIVLGRINEIEDWKPFIPLNFKWCPASNVQKCKIQLRFPVSSFHHILSVPGKNLIPSA